MNRIIEMEKLMSIVQENQLTLADQIKETHRYLVKLARNQSEISKRITQWPFIAVSTKEGDEL